MVLENRRLAPILARSGMSCFQWVNGTCENFLFPEGQWNVRDDRLAAKAIRLQSDRNNALEAIDRKKQARGERQKELAHEMNLIRKALWDGHAVRDQKRKE